MTKHTTWPWLDLMMMKNLSFPTTVSLLQGGKSNHTSSKHQHVLVWDFYFISLCFWVELLLESTTPQAFSRWASFVGKKRSVLGRIIFMLLDWQSDTHYFPVYWQFPFLVKTEFLLSTYLFIYFLLWLSLANAIIRVLRTGLPRTCCVDRYCAGS